MKVVILAGGFGTRISEESHLKPKPMVEIGDMPILWHIMKYYSSFGFNDFIICLGYKQYVIKEFFADYFLHTSDVTFDLATNEMKVLNKNGENWKVTLIDTGLNTMTGGRIKRVLDYIEEDDFFLTYGDGLSNVDLNKLLEFHKSHKKIATITTVSVASMKGVLETNEDGLVTSFREKDETDDAIINGGYMVLNKKIKDYIEGDKTALEKEPFATLAKNRELMSFRHKGFWQCMDTQREMKYLIDLWEKGNAPWKVW
jgi:glucose-1-phosphate cytidylyltransferase